MNSALRVVSLPQHFITLPTWHHVGKRGITKLCHTQGVPDRFLLDTDHFMSAKFILNSSRYFNLVTFCDFSQKCYLNV